MSRSLHFTGISVFLCAFWLSVVAQPQVSVLGEGRWAKFSTIKNGVYQIDYETLKKAGFNPDAVDPRKIRLFGFPTGMLPQSNSIPRPADLSELAIQVTGQEDGRFDKGDLVIFYGQGPDLIAYDQGKSVFSYQNNLFTDKNFYFLTVSPQNGKRASKSADLGSGFPVISEFPDFGYYEIDQYNDLKSGRVWFGEQFDATLALTIRFFMPGIVENSPVRIISNVMAQSYNESTFRLYWNNMQVLDRKMNTILETQYGIKGQVAEDTILTSSSAVGASNTTDQDIRVQYIKGTPGRSVGYLNYVLLNVTRKLTWYGSPTFFVVNPMAQPGSEVELTGVPTVAITWDVTDPFGIQEQNFRNPDNTLRFSIQPTATRSFVVFLPGSLETPELEGEVVNQDLHGIIVPDLVIVTHPDFFEAAQRLAAHREKTYGIEVATVTTTQVFNEFSGGKQDVSAIRDFARHLYLKSAGKLKNILLFGRGSYDYKNRVFNNSNYVPTYESRNSLSPLETFSSDDYFTFLESTEGNWGESPAQDHTLDIGVGRIPVRTASEASQVVDKLIEYDINPARNAGWRQGILFVADDGDFNIHQSQADQLAEDIEFNYQMYHTHKVYLDAFPQEEIASGQVSPKATEALNREINKGFAIINFTGHGSEHVWMQERILDVNTPEELRNNPQMPLLVTATCEFGRYDDPLLISTAENLLFKRKGGAIGLVTTTRPVNSATNFTLNKAFYSSFFDPSPEVKDLGTIFKETKNKSVSGISNRNFSLLGDPSLRFGPPPERILVTSVKTLSDSDTLKALSTVAVEGEITRADVRSNDFNGILEITVLDKRSQLVTLGDENAPFTYQLWAHSLFRGRASIQQGQFRVEFILPVNLASQVGQGKLVMYAFSGDKKREAMDTYTDFNVGGSEVGPAPDNIGPFIELFMGDTTFVNGGYTNSDTRLVGRLSDKSGINISGYDPANLSATLDGSTTFVVNDYFVADQDDFASGSFSFPIDGLTEGKHTITFQAWDNHNNSSVASIDFLVGPEGKLIIEELSNYPNPFSESTTLQFTHSRSGDDLEAQIVIYDLMGQLADSRQFTITSSAYRVTLFEWNGQSTTGTKMSNGLYLMKLSVRSLSDGAKNDKIAKLILVN